MPGFVVQTLNIDYRAGGLGGNGESVVEPWHLQNGVINLPGAAADHRKMPVFLEISDGAAQKAAFHVRGVRTAPRQDGERLNKPQMSFVQRVKSRVRL